MELETNLEEFKIRDYLYKAKTFKTPKTFLYGERKIIKKTYIYRRTYDNKSY